MGLQHELNLRADRCIRLKMYRVNRNLWRPTPIRRKRKR